MKRWPRRCPPAASPRVSAAPPFTETFVNGYSQEVVIIMMLVLASVTVLFALGCGGGGVRSSPPRDEPACGGHLDSGDANDCDAPNRRDAAVHLRCESSRSEPGGHLESLGDRLQGQPACDEEGEFIMHSRALLMRGLIVLGMLSLVFLAGCEGGTSQAFNNQLPPPNGAIPTITTISPNSVAAGGAAFTLTINGTNFVAASIVNFGGTARTTTL